MHPAEIREEIGDTATLKKTLERYLLIAGKRKDAIGELHKVINFKHRRTCKPENWSPQKISLFETKLNDGRLRSQFIC
jgi:hypothetical protein